MGKGDSRTKRGKLFRGTHGNPHPSKPPPAPVKPTVPKAATPKAAKPKATTPAVSDTDPAEGAAEATPTEA